ncbi:MAG: hypothetical protein WBN82_10690, partial [Porticoccaceae bacterium]
MPLAQAQGAVALQAENGELSGSAGVVFFAGDGATCAILPVVQDSTLLAGHYAISFGATLGTLHTVLLRLESCRFSWVQGSGLDALFDPVLLVLLTLVEDRG